MAEIYPLPVSGPPTDWAIDAQALTKQFATEYAVRDLTFQIPRGKIVGLIGPSGCGKTTTVRLLTGIYRPTSGKAVVLGVEPQHFSSSMRERMGYMPQLFVLYPDLSVWENMNFAASIYGQSMLRRGKRLRSLLEFVELDKDRFKLARNISGGMQRRLSLASTLIHNPELLFLDEPTAGIDPILRRKFWDHFHELQNEGRTLVVTTQYVNEAAYCDYVGVMSGGRLILMETPERLKRYAFGGDVVDLKTARPLDWNTVDQIQKLTFVRRANFEANGVLRLVVDEASTAMPALITWLGEQNIQANTLEEYAPPFDDIFVIIVENFNKMMEQQQEQEGATAVTEVKNG